MRKIILIIIAALPGLLIAQTAERQVIGSAGGWATSTSVQASSTVGEAVTSTGTSASVILTQGFQQQSDASSVGIEDLETGLSVHAFPNPATDQVTLQFKAPKAMELTISVFDLSGRLATVPVQKWFISGESNYQIDFSALAAGNYYINLTRSDNKLNQSIKIQKLD